MSEQKKQVYEQIVDALVGGEINHGCIEASAGTGKTYTIEHMVISLIEKGFITLDQLLLVTYTDKAAGELKSRILKALKEGDRTNANVQKAIESIDSAAIHTFHAFCQKTMADHAYDANSAFALELVESNSIDEIVEKSCRDVWSKEKEFTDLLEYGVEISTIVDYIKNFLSKYNENSVDYIAPEFFASGEGMSIAGYEIDVLKNFAKEPDVKYTAIYKDSQHRLEQIKKDLSPFKDEAFDGKKAHCVNEFLDSANIDGSLYNGTYFKDSYFTKFKNAHPEVAASIDDFLALKECQNIINAHKKLKYQFYLYPFAIKKSLEIYKQWQALKKARKQQTFDDMISNVYTEIAEKEYSELADTLRRKYKMAIIDEFQDTNYLQWSIFRGIFLNKNHHLFVVGDPKQSIYSFQGADLNVYKSAVVEITDAGKNKLGNGRAFDLTKNYRATESMVRACNALFNAMKNGNLLGGSLTFVDADSGAKDNVKAMLNGDDLKPVWVCPNASPWGFARFSMDCLKKIFKRDGNGSALQVKTKDDATLRDLKFSDVAILVRTRSEVPAIEKLLKRNGIPFLRYKDEGLFKDKECTHWEWLLRAINTPNESKEFQSTIRCALLSDFYTCYFNRLEQDSNVERIARVSAIDFADKKYREIVGQLKNWRHFASEKKWSKLVESVYAWSRIDDTLSSSTEMQSLAKYHQIGDYILESLATGAYTLESMARHLHNLNKSDDDAQGDKASRVAKGSDLEAVQIMTMHASKGLEFPVVIAAGGFKGVSNKKEKACLLPTEGSTKRQIVFDEKDDPSTFEEWRRLFYVAYTRAQHLLILPDYAIGGGNGPNKQFMHKSIEAFLSDENASLYITDQPEFPVIPKNALIDMPEMKPIENDIPNGQVSDLVAAKLEKLDIQQKVIWQESYSELAHHDHGENVNSENNKHDCDDDSSGVSKDKFSTKVPTKLPAGASFGNALHEIFELLDYSKYEQMTDAEQSRRIENSFRSCLVNYKQEYGPIMKKILSGVLSAELCDRSTEEYPEKFSLKDLPFEDTKREMLFQMYCDDEKHILMKGFIDLLFKRNVNGVDRYYLLDWKSDCLASYDDKGMNAQMEAREYTLQRVLYSYYLVEWLKTYYSGTAEEVFEKHFGGMFYVFARGEENNSEDNPQKCVLSSLDFNDYETLKQKYEEIKGRAKEVLNV